MERDNQDGNEGQGRRGEEKIHGVTPGVNARRFVRRTLLFGDVVARGVPKCNGLRNSRKCLHYESISFLVLRMAQAQGGEWENVFPRRWATRFHLLRGQAFCVGGDRSDAPTVIAIRVRMTASDTTGPTSIQRAPSILRAAKARMAARPK